MIPWRLTKPYVGFSPTTPTIDEGVLIEPPVSLPSWRAQLPTWPLVLTVTPTTARATVLRRATEDVLRRERHPERLDRATEFDFAALPDLSGPHGPPGPIWQIAGRAGVHPLIPVNDRPDEPRGTSPMTGPEAA